MSTKLQIALVGVYCFVAMLLLASPFTVSAASTSTTSSNVQGGIAGGDPTCSAGAICTYTLTIENSGSSGLATTCPGAKATVVVDNTGASTNITVSALQGTSICAPTAIGEFGYNDGSSTFSSVSCGTQDVTSGWSSVGPKTMSQFGSFNNVFTDSSSKCSSVTFTLDQLVTSFGVSTGNNGGFVFAVHAYFVQGTGFIAMPMFPLGAVLGVVAPLAALGLYVAFKGHFKF